MDALNERCLRDLRREILPSARELQRLCDALCDVLSEEQNLVPLRSPVIVLGDVHGQFHDMLEALALCDRLDPEAVYCFAGDYVDRGHHSLETFLYLAVLKLQRPTRICLLRGNHETRAINDVYGLYDEIQQKYPLESASVYRALNEAFNLLPLVALVDEWLVVMHGGLSPEMLYLDEVRTLDRQQEVPHHGLMADLLWSDPDEDQQQTWAQSARGCGHLFGARALREFHHLNGSDCLARGHQLVERGYHYAFEERLCTVWSAPNYCYRCGNQAAVLQMAQGELSEHHFECSPLSSTVATGHLFVDKYFL
jgi:diadenosine tetraphosphatase ApaH/serine/threonine PP2A family protein phosphatase